MTVFEKQTSRSFSFGMHPIPGQTGVQGTILSVGEPFQETKYNRDKSAPKVLDFWDDEKTRPKMGVALELQTDLRDPDAPDDDGKRKLYVTVDYKQDGKLSAIQKAIEAAGGTDLEVGGFLQLWFTNFDPDSANPDNPRQMFAANYRRPPAAGGTFQQQAPAPAAAPAPAPQQYQQPAAAPAQQFQQQQNVLQQPPAPQYQQPAAAPQYQQPAAAPQYQQPAGPGQTVNPGTGELFGAPAQPGGGWQQPAAAPNPAPIPAPAAAIDPNQILAMLSQGASIGDIAAATGAPLETIQAIKNINRLG